MLSAVLLLTSSLAASSTPEARMLEAFESRQNQQALRLARTLLASQDLNLHELDTARLVETFSLLRLKRFREAQAALENLAEEGPDLGTLLGYQRLAVAASLGQCQEMEDFANAIPQDSVFLRPSWARTAHCWLRRKDADRAAVAIDAFDNLVSRSSHEDSSTLLRARLLEARGELRTARDLYRQLLVTHPTSSAARSAKGRLTMLKVRGIRARPLDPHELLSVADAERARNRPAAAKRMYFDIKNRTRKKADLLSIYQRAELGLIEIDIVDRAYTKALKRVKALLTAKDEEVRARATYLKGDLESRFGRVADSLRTFERLTRSLPDSPFALEAALSGARIAYGARYLSRAQAFALWILSQSDQRRQTTVVGDDGVHRQPRVGAARDHALWLLAFIERRGGAPAAVTESYLSQIALDGALGDAALYWRARLAMEAGEGETATIFVDMLTQRQPTSYYALIANDMLSEILPEARRGYQLPSLAQSTPNPKAWPNTPPRDLHGLAVLADRGLKSEALATLRQLRISDLSAADRIAAAWLYGRCDQLHLATMVARRSAQRPKEDVQDPVLFQLAFPRPFGDVVSANAQTYDVPLNLLYAIMREESAFNPAAMSPRRARGLMQMIRPTARRMARDADLKRFRLRKLFQPPTSVHLGTHYVASLLEQFDGNIVAAIASYHAGERTVGRWLKSRGHMSPDEFIEDIPYTSTRRYVKKVLSSYGVYRLLYGTNPRGAIGLRADPKLMAHFYTRPAARMPTALVRADAIGRGAAHP